MKSVRLDQELAGYFFALDPFNCLNKLELPGCFAIGGFLETEDGDKPVSIVVFEVADDRLLIHWMYTLPEHRGEGLGSELLILVFEEAKSRGLTEVAARISDEYDVRAFNWHSWDFFVNSKEEIEKLKAECIASHAHLKEYQDMAVRQEYISRYKETEVFALKSLIELKKDSSVKLTEKEVKNLSILSRYLDKAGFEKIFNMI
ncbi:MAG: GNAT family N-acetyltransferase [Lachnospiraceae bacterium]|nr:GNAT family N-acetyltransferase [Lachnospiraceae bacterium]